MAEDQFYSRMKKWLLHSNIVKDDGAVFSWINPGKPGYVYPEIIGYYIKLLSYIYLTENDKSLIEKAETSANFLKSQLSESGGVSRYGIQYVFDSGICISGLIALSKFKDLTEDQKDTLLKLSEFVYKSLSNKNLVFKDNIPIEELDKWSLSFGSLLIKTSIALCEASVFFKNDKYSELAIKLTDELNNSCFNENHYSINGSREWVYTHPHCYATEGLIYLTSSGIKDYSNEIQASASWLAKNQNDDGSLFNWYNRRDVQLEKQGDATSQTIRIWCFTDKEKYKSHIEKGILFLNSLQSDEGGLYYNEGSTDINSWVTMFSVQAIDWYQNKPRGEWII